jgi:imidazolonepropionase-like amidohydrolase
MQAVWRDEAGVRHTLYLQNPNPRCQVRIRSSIVTDSAGLPLEVRTEGRTCAPPQSADERFTRAGGRVQWENRIERGDTVVSEPRYYMSLSDVPDESAQIARALLAARGELALWPSGRARIERVQQITVRAGTDSQAVTQYRVVGLDFGSRLVWLDARGELFARGDFIRQGWEPALAAVRAAQQEFNRRRNAELERRLVTRPAGKLVIHGARVFDAVSGVVRPNHTVVVSGNRIESVAPTRPADRAAPGAIDGVGQTLLPGLWNSHGHDLGTARQDIAAGVTTIRILAASADMPRPHWEPIETGAVLEPRLVPIAILTGLQTSRRPGQRPQGRGDSLIIARSAEEVRRLVASYAAAGYRQVKMYNELDSAWVPVMIAEARKHGMRPSGHIPNDVTLTEAVEAGLGEVHHANFLLHELIPDLRRLHDNVELPRRAAGVDLDSPEARALVDLLKRQGVVLDPTLVAFEERWTSELGKVPPAWEAVIARFPLMERRWLVANAPGAGVDLRAGATAEQFEIYRRSFATMLELVRRLSDAGVTVLPGTDIMNGFALHRDLELHVRAGIPATRVLQSATHLAARTMRLDSELGAIEPGKLADLVLVEGDPTQNITDIRRVRLVVKDGAMIDVAGLAREIGLLPP